MRFILAAALSLFIVLGVSANNNNKKKELKTFSISGNVADYNEGLAGVKILLDGKEVAIYSDFDGNFTLENITEGEHTLSLSLVAYENKEITFNTNAGEHLEILLAGN